MHFCYEIHLDIIITIDKNCNFTILFVKAIPCKHVFCNVENGHGLTGFMHFCSEIYLAIIIIIINNTLPLIP